MIALILYWLEQLLLMPLIVMALLPWELARIALRRSGWEQLRQRLGIVPPVGGHPFLIHAVSAGEVRAAEALIRALPEGAMVVLTVGNAAGRQWGDQVRLRHPEVVAVSFLPWDSAILLRRFLRSLSPRAVAVVETELWPGLFRTAFQEGIRLVILSGRLRQSEARRYRWIRPLIGATLRCASAISAQTPEDASRYLDLGADPESVSVDGNLKVDLPPLETQAGVSLPGHGGSGLLVVAGSTHDGEETLLFAAMRHLRDSGVRFTLVIAPRDVGRSPSIVALARREGFVSCLLAAEPGEAEVMVVDRFGLLPSLYNDASIAVIGGSLVPAGGHNFMEAAAAGVATIVGPSMEQFGSLVRIFEAAGAVRRLRGPEELEPALRALLADSEARSRMGWEGKRLLGSLCGTAIRCAALFVAS